MSCLLPDSLFTEHEKCFRNKAFLTKENMPFHPQKKISLYYTLGVAIFRIYVRIYDKN